MAENRDDPLLKLTSAFSDVPIKEKLQAAVLDYLKGAKNQILNVPSHLQSIGNKTDASVYNFLTQGINQGTQSQILNAPSGAERAGASFKAVLDSIGNRTIDQTRLGLTPLTNLAQGAVPYARGVAGQPQQPQAAPSIPESLAPVATPPPVQPPVQQPGLETTPEPEVKETSQLGQFLRRMGVPLAAAIAGSVNKDFLPAAAGLGTGYVTEQTRQDEQRAALDIAGVAKEEKLSRQEKEDDKDRRDLAQKLASDQFKNNPTAVPVSPELMISTMNRYEKILSAAEEAQNDAKKIRDSDEYKEFRSQLQEGEVLILRGGDIMAVTNKEIKDGDIRL